MLPFLIGADGVVRNGASHHGSTTPPFAKKRANGTPPNLGGDFFRTSLNVQTPVAGFSRVLSRNFPNQLILSRSNASQADMSERITRSPICRPSLISMVLTDARPSLT